MVSSNTLHVCAAQINSTGDPATNLNTVTDAIRDAAGQGAQLVVLPEAAMACFGTPLKQVAEPLDGPWANSVRKTAAEENVTAVVGMFEPTSDGRVYNTLLVTGPTLETAYRKCHLYDALGACESDSVAPGDEYVTVQLDGFTVGLATCFDLRFADQFTALGRAGAELVVVPASWGDGPGKADQWDRLVHTRAMDSQAWLLACDQAWTPPVGSEPLGVGRSALVDPIGRTHTQLGHEPSRIVTTVDSATVRSIRESIPLFG